MPEVTRLLSAIEQGDPHAAAPLLPLVYDELRQLAAHKLAQEKPGQTLQATALVHEAWLACCSRSELFDWAHLMGNNKPLGQGRGAVGPGQDPQRRLRRWPSAAGTV
jgi:hypothetical protein